jgi:1,4-alpha-glucan branching enzyme
MAEDQGEGAGPTAEPGEPLFAPFDLHLFGEGRHHHVHRILGAHPATVGGQAGVRFGVWAPNARRVAVVGEWNGWKPDVDVMRPVSAGVWGLFVPAAREGQLYKYEVVGEDGVRTERSDPFAAATELRPGTASRIYQSRHAWADEAWVRQRGQHDPGKVPMTIYEVHLPSWRRRPREVAPGEPPPPPEAARRWMTYRELADELVDYVADLGFTHVELLPILEHPFDGSWGYQVTGFFAPTSRLGAPDDFRYFVERAHEKGIGVILDWVPAHFPRDTTALARFDGTPLFEHWDPRRGAHKQWGTMIFDWAKPQVRNFLLASALSWLEDFHVDGLRVDAVASMLYLDYGSQSHDDWARNEHGGRENLDAVAFLRELNDLVHARCPGAIVCAEESTAWPGVTRPTYTGGLGFDFKWNMGWMHDTLKYFSMDPIFRSFHHEKITFGLWYAWGERYLQPLSHDEVVHLKRSLWSKMPGDDWRRAANLRAMFAMMWAHPGKKLLFMGGEIGQTTEWNFEAEVEWAVTSDPLHGGVQRLVRDVNRHYAALPALWQLDDRTEGFSWIDANDTSQSVFSWIRWSDGDGPTAPAPGEGSGRHVVMIANLTPVPRTRYRVGLPRRCDYLELLNTDATEYGGSGVGNMGRVAVEDVACHGRPQSALVELPPLAVLWLVPSCDDDPAPPATGAVAAGDAPPDPGPSGGGGGPPAA